MKTTSLIPVAGGLAVALVAALPSPGRGGAYPDRAPPAHTGGFGEPTCAQCHFGAQPNAPGGRLSIDGVPDEYRPGERYRLTIRAERPGLEGGGFQLSARFTHGGAQAGSLRAVDARAQVVSASSGVQYAGHTEEGVVSPGEGRIAWEVEWTAPASTSGPVAFHAAANAANGDASAFGDFVYTQEKESRAPAAGN